LVFGLKIHFSIFNDYDLYQPFQMQSNNHKIDANILTIV